MRFSAFSVLVCLGLTACWSGPSKVESPFVEPNSLMAQEIDERIAQVPFQQREELFNNLLWLAQTGEQSIPALLAALQHENPKVRSNVLWVLGRIRDRRTIPQMQLLVRDKEEMVQLEAARSLVLMGDLQHVPILVGGLDSERNEVRYFCHQALKSSTGRNFGYDHLEDDLASRQQATYRWRKWWADQSGDPWFAKDYASDKGLDVFEAENQWLNGSAPPAPQGETESIPMPGSGSGSSDSINSGSSGSRGSDAGEMIIEIVDPNQPAPSAGGSSSDDPDAGWVDPAGTGGASSGSTVSTTPK